MCTQDKFSVTSLPKGNVATQRCDESEIGGGKEAASRKGKLEGEYRKNEFPSPVSLSLSVAEREKVHLMLVYI